MTLSRRVGILPCMEIWLPVLVTFLVVAGLTFLAVYVPYKLVTGVFERRRHSDLADHWLSLVDSSTEESVRGFYVKQARYHAHHAGYHDGHDCECLEPKWPPV